MATWNGTTADYNNSANWVFGDTPDAPNEQALFDFTGQALVTVNARSVRAAGGSPTRLSISQSPAQQSRPKREFSTSLTSRNQSRTTSVGQAVCFNKAAAL